MTQEISWWPSDIEFDHDAGHWIDPETGKQTYPSAARRAQVQLIRPEDLDERSLPKDRDDEIFCRALTHQLHQNGVGLDDSIPTDDVVRAIQDLDNTLGVYNARAKLYRLWHVGLVQRYGQIYSRSGRPMNQTWKFV